MDIIKLRDKPTQFLSLTGLKVEIFDQLLSFFDYEYFNHFTLNGIERKRIKTFRKDNVFKDSQEVLFFLLIYIKNNPLQEYHGATWGD